MTSIASSGSSILISNARGGVAIGGPTSFAGPVCLGNITRPKEWNSLVTADQLLGFQIAKVFCGPYHFCAVTSTYNIITWGLNVDIHSEDAELTGQLGHTFGPVCPPILLDQSKWRAGESLSDSGTVQENLILDIACGGTHTVILTQNDIYTCGGNQFGQLGRKKRKMKDKRNTIPDRIKKEAFMTSDGDPISMLRISAGMYHTISLSTEGKVWGWGRNHKSQLGRANVPHFSTPIRIAIPTERNIIQIACGYDHCLALTANGEVYGWGDNLFGQVGVPSPSVIVEPKKLSFDNKEQIVKVRFIFFFTFFF